MISKKQYELSGSIVEATGLFSRFVLDKKIGGIASIQSEDYFFTMPVGKLFRVCFLFDNLPMVMPVFEPIRKSIEIPYVLMSTDVKHEVCLGKNIVFVSIPCISLVYSEFSIELYTYSWNGFLLNRIRMACRAKLVKSEEVVLPKGEK